MLRDCTISGAYDHLQRSIVGHDYHFEPKDPKNPKHRALCAIQEQLTKEMRGLSQSLYNLSRASFYGATWGYIEPGTVELTIDGKTRTWTIIKRVRDVNKRRFRLSNVGSTPEQSGILYGGRDMVDPRERERERRTLVMERINGGVYSLSKDQPDAPELGWRWQFHPGPGRWWQDLIKCAPADRFIQHVVDTSEQGLAYGYGQADELYFLFWAKQNILRFGLQGLERWGQGFLYAKIKALRDGMPKGQSQQGAIQQTLKWLRAQRAENLSVVDADTELGMIDMPATANAQCLAWVEYLDHEIVKRILSALQPTGGSDGTGSYSSAAVEETSTDATVAYLRSPLEETWTHGPGKFLIDHNQENLAELGLAGIPSGRLRLQGREKRDVELVLKSLEMMQKLGLPMVKSEVYKLLSFTQPNEDHGDDVINFPKPVAGADQDGLFGPDGTEKPMREPIEREGEAVGDKRAA
jgi:hypothetical protein